ncbi:MAG: hypothetical protein H6830_03215 [Planctomycetes bacterium]|nr:hypothetical protein [Planctomycetota bacterium]MCB9910698.1 hypothetical protein [Planctomycetota bacterium]HPF14872.1 hypothetical protein [Planctomycetota bacterium]
MTTNLRTWALASLAAFALGSPACTVVAAAGLGFAISQEFTDNAHSLRLEGSLEETWRATRATLDALSLDPVKTDEKEHVLQAVVRGSQVTAHVRAHDAGETVLSVTAKSYGRYQNELAEDILFRVRDRMKP